MVGERPSAIGMGSWIAFSAKSDGKRERNSRTHHYVPIHVPPASFLVGRDPSCVLIQALSAVATLTATSHAFNPCRPISDLDSFSPTDRPCRAIPQGCGRGS